MENELADRIARNETGHQWDTRVWLAVGLVLLGAALNAIYLFRHCPIDLSEDETHYWEWSRHLDYGYYSKPPGIAWVIWAAIRIGAMLGINGDGSGAALAPVMRMAAVIFGMCSGLLSLFLARRMFGGKGALAVILLSAAVPMFAVGSLLITIDAPMYLCWAGTVYCLWRCVENAKLKTQNANQRVTWLYAAGVCAGMGMLFKPVGIVLPVCCFIAALADREGARRAFKTWHALGAIVVMMASQVPVLVWNARHGWVMFLHIGTQGGLAGGVTKHKGFVQAALLDPLSRVGAYVGGQAGGMGGVIFVLLVIAVVVAWTKARAATQGKAERTRWVFLLSFAVPLWGFYFLLSLWKGTEPNWPAASYFAGMILLAGVVAEGWSAAEANVRKAWRVWGGIAVVSGILITTLVMNFYRFFPVAASHLEPLKGTPKYFSSRWHPVAFWAKPLEKVIGMQARAEAIEPVREALAKETGQEPLIMTGRYDTSSSLAFYLPGQPFVYCLMSNLGGRKSQYDLWPGLNETAGDKPVLAGRPAVIVGIDGKDFDEVVRPAFERVEGPEKLPIVLNGITLKMVVVYRAWGYKGHIGTVVGAGGSY